MVKGFEATPVPADASLFGADLYVPREEKTSTRIPGQDRGARTCGAAGCTSGWVKPWKNRKRPIFEEEWGCSSRCLKTMVMAALRRETGQVAPLRVDTPHRHRIPLGLVLLAQGWITHPQLQAALEAQKQTGQGRIGDWLVQSCGLAEDRVTRGLGVQWSCPVLALSGFSPSSMALVMPKRFIAEFGMVPLRVAGSELLYLAFESRKDAASALAAEQMTGLKVESGLLNASDFQAAREKLLAADGVPATMEQVADADAAALWLTRKLETTQPVAARLVRVHQYYWMRVWLESGAMSGVGTLPTSHNDVHDFLVAVGDSAGGTS